MMLWPTQDGYDVVIYGCDHPCEHPVNTSFLLVSILKRNTIFFFAVYTICGLKNTRVSFCSFGLLQQEVRNMVVEEFVLTNLDL